MIRIGFDLDGTLDKPALAVLARVLMQNPAVEVHIITGIFAEAGEWQSVAAKLRKLERLGISVKRPLGDSSLGCVTELHGNAPYAILHTLVAVAPEMGLDYRLRDLGLRKAALTEELGISVFLDDSKTYCDIMPAMNGGLTILQVR